MGEKDNINALYKRFLLNECSEKESQIIRFIITECEENQLLSFEDIQALGDEKIVLDEKRSQEIFSAVTSLQQNRNPYSKNAFLQLAAAIILFLSVAIALYTYWSDTLHKPVRYVNHSLFMRTIYLTDSTSVLLRQGSELTVLSDFDRDSIRRVALTGEAFFNVSKNREKPFIVDNDNAFSVHVLGTEFYLSSAGELTQLVLNVGSVMVQHRGQQALVKPSEKVYFDTKEDKFDVSPVDTATYCSWKYNLLYFTETPVQNIVTDLQALYPEKTITSDEKYKNLQFTGYLPQHDLEKTADILNKAFNNKTIIIIN